MSVKKVYSRLFYFIIVFLDSEINFTVENNIDVSMNPATAFVNNFQFEILY